MEHWGRVFQIVLLEQESDNSIEIQGETKIVIII